MKKTYRLPIIALLLCILTYTISCSSDKTKVYEETINEWNGRQIVLPSNSVYTKMMDTTDVEPNNYKFKILTYTDARGCIGCRLRLKEWLKFNKTIQSITDGNIAIIKYISPRKIGEAWHEIKVTGYDEPICIDLSSEIDSLNHFPKDEMLRCFLLDENNKVVLIGNPMNNSNVYYLYIKTLCKAFDKNIDTIINELSDGAESKFDFAQFNYREPQNTQFKVTNHNNQTITIDSVYTSCDCTTASIDKTEIQKGEYAIISVTFKADKPEQFMREIYVKILGEEAERVYTIEGEAIDEEQ